MTVRKTSLQVVAAVALVSLLATVWIVLARHPGTYQWDLQTYYYGARAFEEGKNPYDREVLSAIADTPLRFRYVYPPHTLPVMRILTEFSLRGASLFWLVIKGILICILFRVWSRLLPGIAEPGYLLLAVCAFNGAILSDAISGNISLLEQAFLWGGFLMLRKNLTASALLIAAASFFKVTYALFLVLPLIVPGAEGRRRAFVLGVFFVVAPLVLSAVVTPELFRAFLDAGGVLADPLERGENNPCLFAFLLTLADVVREVTGWAVPAGAVVGLFALHATALVAVSWRRLRIVRRAGGPDPLVSMVLLLTVLYPFLVPRFKNYAYILIIPAALSLVLRGGTGGRERWLLIFILVAPTFSLFGELLPLTEYTLFFVGYVLFWFVLSGEEARGEVVQG
jgi:hypothetical protein